MVERLMILCSDGAHHKYLISMLSDKFNVVGIVVEPYAKQMHRRLCNGRYIDYIYMMYHVLRRKLAGYSQYRNDYFLVEPTWDNLLTKIASIEVESINDKAVWKFAKESNPSIVVVMGTSIISRNTLPLLGDVVINIHGGYLPDYKGNNCFFFALYNKDYKKIASTIHFVNTGVDAGDIIERIHPTITSKDNAETLYCKAEMGAIHRLAELIENYCNGKPFPREIQPDVGRNYLTRDRKPRHDLRMLLRRHRIMKEIEKL